jgi:exopolysaccharide biosynthesis polyprenyl glycosylphosphotransferase
VTTRERSSSPGVAKQGAPSRVRPRVPYTPPVVPTPKATSTFAPALFVGAWVLADALAIAAGFLATYWLRFRSGWLPTPLGIPSWEHYLVSLVVVVPVALAVARSLGLYRRKRQSDFARDILGGARLVVSTCVLLAAIAFFYRGFSFSRTFLFGFVLVAPVLFATFRRGAAAAQRFLISRGVGIQRVAIVGGGEFARHLATKIRSRPGTGLEIVAMLDGEEWRGDVGSSERALRPGRVRSLIARHRIDRLIVTDSGLGHEERVDVVEVCHAAGVRCDLVPDMFEVMLGRVDMDEIDGVPLIGHRLHPLRRVDRFEKRALDLVLSATSLVVFAPLLAAIAVAVRLDSKGPVLFRQPRIGRDGREFDIFKFRSMPVAAESESGPVRASRADDRATRFGRVLRRTSLDELPQLWNVLCGEMSLVGPRPERQHFVDQFERDIPRYLERHGVKSGLTGWAQANGLRGDTSIEERTRLDIWYVENWSIRLDLKILWLTLVRFLSHDNAY